MSLTRGEGITTGAAARWLRSHGINVCDSTVRSWCLKDRTGEFAYRTLGGHYRVRLSALQSILTSNGLDAQACA